MGLPRPGDREAPTGPIQAVLVATATAVVAGERTKAGDPEELARVLARVRGGGRGGGDDGERGACRTAQACRGRMECVAGSLRGGGGRGSAHPWEARRVAHAEAGGGQGGD